MPNPNLNISSVTGNPKPMPEVGMGATYGIGSDSTPYTVVEVKSPRRIVVRRDNHTRISGSGHDGSAQYEYSPNPDADTEIFTLRANGSWYREGTPMSGGSLALGFRLYYRDPCF